MNNFTMCSATLIAIYQIYSQNLKIDDKTKLFFTKVAKKCSAPRARTGAHAKVPLETALLRILSER